MVGVSVIFAGCSGNSSGKESPAAMNNRSLTLDGANKIFSALNIEIERHTLGYFQAAHKGQAYRAKTLTELCQMLLIAIANL